MTVYEDHMVNSIINFLEEFGYTDSGALKKHTCESYPYTKCHRCLLVCLRASLKAKELGKDQRRRLIALNLFLEPEDK